MDETRSKDDGSTLLSFQHLRHIHDMAEIFAFRCALAFRPQLSSISLRNLGPKGTTEQSTVHPRRLLAEPSIGL